MADKTKMAVIERAEKIGAEIYPVKGYIVVINGVQMFKHTIACVNKVLDMVEEEALAVQNGDIY